MNYINSVLRSGVISGIALYFLIRRFGISLLTRLFFKERVNPTCLIKFEGKAQ